jgi:hypothetical protein
VQPGECCIRSSQLVLPINHGPPAARTIV